MIEVAIELDPSRYLRAPVVDVPGAVALGIALLSSTERSLSGAPAKSAKQLRSRVVALQAAWGEQQAAPSATSVDPRPADQRLDRAWGAVGRRLESLAELPESVPEARLAAALHARLFPEGLAFLALPFEKQWAESERRLARIDADPEAKKLGSLVGEFVLVELREAHAAYGRVLGITAAKVEPAPRALLAEPLRAVTQSIASYALQVVAAAHAEPSLAPAARKALRPIDDLRAAQARRTAAGEPKVIAGDGTGPSPAGVSPTTPVPPAPEA